MLEMRPSCECCDRDLAPWAEDVLICSFECTWCTRCAATFTDGRCPNCHGVLSPRPTRSRAQAASIPASSVRVFEAGCMSSRGVTSGA